jgi:hypothetical protein
VYRLPATSRVLAAALLSATLTACAGPELAPFAPPPVVAAPRPALAIAPLVRLDRASADRRVQDRTDKAERDRTFAEFENGAQTPVPLTECATCGENAVDDSFEPCAECGGLMFRRPFTPPFRPRVDDAAIRARASELLLSRGVFAKVDALPADDPKVEPGLEPTPEMRHVWAEMAKARGARFLLEPVLEESRVELLEKNGWHAFKVVNLIVSSIFIFPAVDPLNWVIPGEDYGYVQRLRWRLTDLERPEAGSAVRVQELVTRASFNDFGPGPSRGFFVVGFLRAPGCLDEEDWAGICAELKPVAVEELARALVIAAETDAK